MRTVRMIPRPAVRRVAARVLAVAIGTAMAAVAVAEQGRSREQAPR